MNDDLVQYYSSQDPFTIIADQIIFGRDYRLNDLPKDATGNLLFEAYSEGDYSIYVNWLADYLHQQEIAPNERQEDLCRIVSKMDKDKAMYLLGMYAALYEYILLDTDTHLAISERIDDPCNFSEDDIDWIYSRSLEIKKEYDEWAEKEAGDGAHYPKVVVAGPLSLPVSRENIRQYLLEEAEKRKCYDFGDFDFADVAWRIPLSVVLKDVNDKNDRTELLEIFFDLFSEYISK